MLQPLLSNDASKLAAPEQTSVDEPEAHHSQPGCERHSQPGSERHSQPGNDCPSQSGTDQVELIGISWKLDQLLRVRDEEEARHDHERKERLREKDEWMRKKTELEVARDESHGELIRSQQSHYTPLCCIFLACVSFAILALTNDLQGKNKKLLDLGKANGWAFANFLWWALAIPWVLWKTHDCMLRIHARYGKTEAVEQREVTDVLCAAKRWCVLVALSIWTFLFLEVHIFMSPAVGMWELIAAMVMMAWWIFFVFQYVLAVARLVKLTIERWVGGSAKDIKSWIDGHGESKQPITDWPERLITYCKGRRTAKKIWKDFALQFNAGFVFSFLYVGMACFNIARESTMFDLHVQNITGTSIIDIITHHKWNQTAGIVDAAEEHVATLALLVMNLVYLFVGVGTLFAILWMMGSVNASRSLSEAIEEYVEWVGRLDAEKSREFHDFVNMTQRMQNDSAIATLFSCFPVTKSMVSKWAYSYKYVVLGVQFHSTSEALISTVKDGMGLAKVMVKGKVLFPRQNMVLAIIHFILTPR